MALTTDAALLTAAGVIKNETVANANTASRVGTLLENIIDSKPNLQGTNATAITVVKVSLSSAEILALFTTPKTLVAAPGAGKIINVLNVVCNMNFVTVVYATSTDLTIAIGDWTMATLTGILASAVDTIVSKPCGSVTGIPANVTNTALKVSVPTANPTAGDGTADIYITYNIISL